MFIESSYIQNSILSDAEESAIIAEAVRENSAAHAVIVDGGVMVFATWDDYATWTEQA